MMYMGCQHFLLQKYFIYMNFRLKFFFQKFSHKKNDFSCKKYHFFARKYLNIWQNKQFFCTKKFFFCAKNGLFSCEKKFFLCKKWPFFVQKKIFSCNFLCEFSREICENFCKKKFFFGQFIDYYSQDISIGKKSLYIMFPNFLKEIFFWHKNHFVWLPLKSW